MSAKLPSVSLPPVDRSALLLDLDGTLVDIAPRPEAVVIDETLPAALLALRKRLGDALAIVSGRPIEQIDALLPDIPFAVAGEHGGAIRHAPNQQIARSILPTPPSDWIAAATRIVRACPGTRVESKAHGFVLHYREAPQFGAMLRDTMEPLLAGSEHFVIMPARKAWEIKPRGADKGVAVSALMQSPPFAGRVPIYIGDDVTDEDGIAAAEQLGGTGLRVPERFETASGVRAWLSRAAASAEAAWPGL
ncbi:MAG: trehalose-phosphatase [Acetobacteraceae bacterium]|nr:trehalose-phosphatase [Acetobacteraceae bacterium]